MAGFVSGCTQKYTVKEYDAVRLEMESCRQALEDSREENTRLSQELSEKERQNERNTVAIRDCQDEKQTLLDKNIECLENNKILLSQISHFKSLMQERKEAQWRLNKAYEYVLSLLDTERVNDQAYIIKTNERIKIVLPQRVLFPTARSAWLTPRGARIIEKIAHGMKQMDPGYIEIAGHTDNEALPESTQKVYPTNWHLAQARSLSVLGVFEQQGFPRDKISAISFADTRPIADNSSADGRAMNRRVEIIILP